MSRNDNSERVARHFERRKSEGEIRRHFFVREEHIHLLRQYQVQNGHPNLNSAIQAVLEDLRLPLTTEGNDNVAPRPRNRKPRDGA